MAKREVYDETYDKTKTEEENAILYFKSLIPFKQKQGNCTTVSVMAGHVRRHMNDRVKSWFVEQYPNPSDYLRFFWKHKHIFQYDPNTANVTLKHMTQLNGTFTKPLFLVQLESDASELLIIPFNANKTRDELNKASQLMLQFEAFYKIFNIFKQRYESFHQNTLLSIEVTIMMREDLNNKRIKQFIENFDDCGFESNLIKFITEKIPEIFVYDKSDEIFEFRDSLLSQMQEIQYEINDSAITLLKTLTIKLFRFKSETMGCLQIDVNKIINDIQLKHPYVFGNLFTKDTDGSSQNNYIFTDFLMTFPDTFILSQHNGRQFMSLKMS